MELLTYYIIRKVATQLYVTTIFNSGPGQMDICTSIVSIVLAMYLEIWWTGGEREGTYGYLIVFESIKSLNSRILSNFLPLVFSRNSFQERLRSARGNG